MEPKLLTTKYTCVYSVSTIEHKYVHLLLYVAIYFRKETDNGNLIIWVLTFCQWPAPGPLAQ